MIWGLGFRVKSGRNCLSVVLQALLYVGLQVLQQLHTAESQAEIAGVCFKAYVITYMCHAFPSVSHALHTLLSLLYIQQIKELDACLNFRSSHNKGVDAVSPMYNGG